MNAGEISDSFPEPIIFTDYKIDNNKSKKWLNSKFTYLFFVICICVILYNFFFTNNNKLHPKRNLLTHQEYLSLCYNKDTNTLLGFDISKLNTYNVAFNDYIASLNNYDKTNEIYIEQAVSGNFNSIWQLSKKLLIPFMVVGAFSGVTFISWLIFCGCHFRKSFCCKSDEVIEPKRGCKLVSLVIFTISIAVIILFSFLGIIFSFNLLRKINEFECLLLQFYSDTKFGQLNTEQPRWLGYNSIPSFIYDLQNNYISIENEFKSIFRKADWVDKERQKLISELDTIWEKHRNDKKVNPDAESSDKVIIPDIIEVSNINLAFRKIRYSIYLFKLHICRI